MFRVLDLNNVKNIIKIALNPDFFTIFGRRVNFKLSGALSKMRQHFIFTKLINDLCLLRVMWKRSSINKFVSVLQGTQESEP